MALSINNRVLCMVVCLHVLLACLPTLVISKPTLDVASEVKEEEEDNDDNLRDRAAGSEQTAGTEQGTQQQTEQPTADDRTPEADERAPEADDRAPEADERTPEADERAQEADERAPEADEGAPEADERVPEAEERAQEADEGVPEADESRAPYAVNNAEPGSQQYGAGNVEEMVHGDMTSHGHDARVDDDVKTASGTMDVEHYMHGSEDVHEGQEKPQDHLQQQQSGPDDVEKMVHGQGDVHTMTSAEEERAEDFKKDIGTENVEHMMHGGDDVHEAEKKQENPALAQEFQAGNVENMVHGQDHVHDGKGQGEGQGQTQDHYTAGEDDILKLGAVNVHDPAQRAKIATAGDISALMGGGEKKEKNEGRAPTVVDSEHLMHGDGGHDHDVRRLKDLKLKQDGDQPKDRFSDLHNIILDDGDGHHHDNDQIHRGKAITYKDIMDLGLDEDFLKGIDLKKLLVENAREYDDWQREKDVIKGESPEASFWEQVGDLRRRYLPFGRNDGPARDLTGSKLDPSQQKWVSQMEGARGDREEGEDGVLHDIEILGSTAPKQLRHQQQHHQQERDNYHTNGRDATDL